ncbi:hypothetical protein [Arthrobacter bambusae]|uniref:hypothetical protein n=1 Tax=Arthrobacter bambusae TaxID=1338426 RepID=UPI003522BAB6
MSSSIRKSVLVGVAGLSLTGAVAGCAPAQSAPASKSVVPTPAASASRSVSGSAAASSSASPANTSAYKDGSYSADGTYTSPNGQETVGVQLNLSGGTVSGVDITVHATNPNSKKFQSEFKDGIAAQVVGKKLDEINVSKVAGSSLAGAGFNQAVEAIKSQAK